MSAKRIVLHREDLNAPVLEKGDVKKKHVCAGWTSSCFTTQVNERDLF
jgi:hypothetical protein